MPVRLRILISAYCLCIVGMANAQQQFSSGPTQTVMIELYTSQGCSSCPPAEEFLNTFVDNPRLWTSFVPIAFHVDYWDYLGWRDAFALPDNAKRQRRYADLNNVRTVYTPAFVVNGRGWRPGWFNKKLETKTRQVGTLTINIDGNHFTAAFDAREPSPSPLQLHIGVLGMGLKTSIKAGENHGRDARHEFVLLAHQQRNSHDTTWTGRLADRDPMHAERRALVAWVSRRDDPTPLQATGGYLDD